MSMRWKQKLPLLVKILTNLTFASLLLYWTYLAFDKYNKQPLATVVSYTEGDNETNIEFPHIAFCPQEFGFIEKIRTHVMSNSSFDVAEYLAKNSPSISDFFLAGSFNKRQTVIQNISEDYFYPIFNVEQGLCIDFDAAKLKATINDDLTTAGNTWLNLTLNFSSIEAGPDDFILAYFHSKNDTQGPNQPLSFTKNNQESKGPSLNEIVLKKKFIKKDSTKMKPCNTHDVRTCYDIEGNRKVAQSLGCKIVQLYSGKHLEEYVAGYSKLPACNNDGLHDAIQQYLNVSDRCNHSKACESVSYDLRMTKYPEEVGNPTEFQLYVQFATFEVEHSNTYISYDFQSLIAEVGGLLGMTLGLSFASVGDLIANLIKARI